MPESMSIERRKLLKKFGAELVLTPAAGGMKAAIAKAVEIAAENPNPLFPSSLKTRPTEVHRTTTAEEIWNDTDGKIDVCEWHWYRRDHYRSRRGFKQRNPNVKSLP